MKELNSKKFYYSWDDIDEGNKDAGTLLEDILAYEQLPKLDVLIKQVQSIV